ncbi:MAG TPA: HAMP domain-containing sensor histidine kinase [Candidatus Thermoplasmatota archaeon]|nr:HAMP domain-containing sensor histidine kinase [Candidatus Thermoplasmatota archaeon]
MQKREPVSSARSSQLARFRSFRRFFYPLLGTLALADLGIYAWLGEAWIGAVGLAAIAAAALVALAATEVERGRDRRAFALLAAALLGASAFIVLVQPLAAVVAGLGPVLLASIAISLGGQRHIKPILIAAWITGALVAALGLFMDPLMGAPSQAALAALGVGYAAGLAIILAVLGRHAHHAQKSLDQLARLDRFKAGLINLAAHDLRTPLTPALLKVHVLKMEAANRCDATQHAALGFIERNLQRLSSVVDDFIDVAQFQARGLPADGSVTDVCGPLQEATTDAAAHGRGRGVEITGFLHPPLSIVGEGARLRNAFASLIRHATTRLGAGGRLSVHADKQLAYARVSIHCENPSTGLPNAGAFFPANERMHEGIVPGEEEGLGIGLYSAHEILRMHGATTQTHSDPAAGLVRLRILFPLANGTARRNGHSAFIQAATAARTVQDAEPSTQELVAHER